jgi:hypothetical protein
MSDSAWLAFESFWLLDRQTGSDASRPSKMERKTSVAVKANKILLTNFKTKVSFKINILKICRDSKKTSQQITIAKLGAGPFPSIPHSRTSELYPLVPNTLQQINNQRINRAKQHNLSTNKNEILNF